MSEVETTNGEPAKENKEDSTEKATNDVTPKPTTNGVTETSKQDEDDNTSSSSSSNGELKIDISEDDTNKQKPQNDIKPAEPSQDETSAKPAESENKTTEPVKDTSEKEIVEKPADSNHEDSASNSSPTKRKKQKKDTLAQQLVDESSSATTETNASSSTRGGRSRSLNSSKRPVDRGLDGGYWSRVGATNNESSSALETRRKRQRTTVERLEYSYLSPVALKAAFKSSDKQDRAASVSANNSIVSDDNKDDKQDDDNASLHSQSTNQTSSANTSKNYKDRYILFKAKSFITVRNEEKSFFLCQCINSIYEDSKKCKIQWLEELEDKPNRYKYGLVDWIDPFTIISKVHVKEAIPNKLFEIEKSDLEKVNKLLEKALKDGGITVDFSEEEDDDDDDDEKSESSSSSSTEEENKKSTKQSKISKKKKSSDESSDSSNDNPYKFKDEKNDVTPKIAKDNNNSNKKSNISSVTIKKSPNVISKTAPTTPAISNNKSLNQVPKSAGSSAQSDKKKIRKRIDSSSSSDDDSRDSVDAKNHKPTKKPLVSSSNNTNSNKTTPVLAKKTEQVKKKRLNSDDSDTDAIDSESEIKKSKKKPTDSSGKPTQKPQLKPAQGPTTNITPKLVKKVAPTNGTGKPTTPVLAPPTVPPPPPSTPNTSANVPALIAPNQQLAKKRRLNKVVSNRLLEENTRVTVFEEDPFFEDKQTDINKLPYISPYVQSKLAFRAINLSDLNLLKKLIDDYDRVPSVHIGKSIYNNWIPAQYALYLENKQALELLFDNYYSPKSQTKPRVQIAESMFKKFTTGVYNPKLLGGTVPFVRKLTESRGAKEGNNAFNKDDQTLSEYNNENSAYYNRNGNYNISFVKSLFNVAFEYGSSIEMFDFLLAKWKHLHEANPNVFNNCYSSQVGFICENIIKAILYGHRKLAAHIIETAPDGLGFNAVHIEVLKADNDSDLKCQLRANMCTKKPNLYNDLVTPIHCASINPNVKYLKTLLSITQDFNIVDKKGRKPVHYAAVCEGPSPLEYLISRVSPYELDSMGNTPLHFACLAGRSMNVEILLSHAQSKQEDDSALTTEVLIDNKYGIGGINKPNRMGRLPIHLAISRDNFDCVKVLIKYSANIEYPLPSSMGKITPLMYACQLGNQRIVKLLIENNAKVEARDRFQRTAVIHATMCGHTSTLSYLLRLGANPNVTDSSGNSALHYACAYGWYHAVKLLLDAGALVNVANDWKLTPFGAAFLKGHVGICDQLLALHREQIDVNFRTEDGETLVMLCVSNAGLLNQASVDQLDYIVNKLGGKCDLVDSRGNNAFHYLAANKIDKNAFDSSNKEKLKEQEDLYLKMADKLLKSNCNANAENNDMETPLYTALVHGNNTMTKYLLENRDKTKCTITTKQYPNGGRTFLAIMSERLDSFDSYSILNSIDGLQAQYSKEFEQMASIKDEKGFTPFMIACTSLKQLISSKRHDSLFTSLPKYCVDFMKFLYRDCKSDPNEVIIEQKSQKKVQAEVESESDNENLENGVVNGEEKMETDENADEEMQDSTKTDSVQTTYSPIFDLIDDKCTALIEALYELSQNDELNLKKLDFNCYNGQGLTPVLKSIIDGESSLKLINKLIDLGAYTVQTLTKHVCRNSSEYLNENILQMCIRHGRTELLERILDIYTKSKANLGDFIEILQHQNIYNQNFLHVLASLDPRHRNKFTLKFLNSILSKITKYLSANNNSNLLAKLLAVKDKLGRNPLHICLLNKHLISENNIDLQLFFTERLAASSNGDFLIEKDIYGRAPIHYLFYDQLQFERLSSLSSVYQSKASSISAKLKSNPTLENLDSSQIGQIKVIDPVELLTIVIRLTNKKNIDEKDVFGYTALHYACIRGSTISCSLLISNGCDYMSRANTGIKASDAPKGCENKLGNTPLSSSIYFRRETCILALLRLIESDRKTNPDLSVLNDYYYLNPKDYKLNDSADLYPIKFVNLYKLILECSREWEGINWLILGELKNYGLTMFDSILNSILSLEFGLALRLIEKYEQQLDDQMEFLKMVTQKSNDHSRTLLHAISLLNMSAVNSEKDKLVEILNKIFSFSNLNEKYKQLINEFLLCKDELGSTALHYACFMRNFQLIDLILEHNQSDNEVSLLASVMDSNQQTAYSLLFWQIGRVNYPDETKEKIKSYTNKYILNNSNQKFLEQISRAYYPHVNLPNFKSEDSVHGKVVHDYPPKDVQLMISPLLYAISRQNFDMCRFLIKDLGFDVNTSDSNQVSAIVYAIRTNNINICKVLLNPDYVTAAENKEPVDNKNKPTKGAAPRISALFNTINITKTKPKAKAGSDDEEVSSELSGAEEEEDEAQQVNAATNQTNDISPDAEASTKFKIKSSIVLNSCDSKNRTIFHHLANSLEYGSFRNINIARLLSDAYTTMFTEDLSPTKLIPLNDFLKRVDSNVITASEYALKNGNLELFDEFKKILNKTGLVVTNDQYAKLNKFTINDKNYGRIKPDFSKDAELFLKENSDKNPESKDDDNSYFYVDRLSNMSKIGQLVWDTKAKIPYDIILTKTDVSYGLYGVHNFYKMQLITHSFNHDKEKFDETQMCVLFTRWGRIGETGQYQRTPFANFKEAKNEFVKIFKQKTGNDFIDTVLDKKKPFENKPRRYNLVRFESRRRPRLTDIEFDLFDNDPKNKVALFSKSMFVALPSSDDYRHFWLDMMHVDYLKEQTIQNTRLSAEYLPLTQLSSQSIEKAFNILDKNLRPLIEKRMELEKLAKKEYLMEYMNLLDQINKYSNEYYELIPQMNYDYEKLVPISNERELEIQISTLNQLTNTQIACRILMGARYAMKSALYKLNPFDYIYSAINCRLELLNSSDSKEYQYILRYACPGASDQSNRHKIKRIFKFERDQEQERFDKYQLTSGADNLFKLKSRVLLWHGTGTQNLISIMSKGLIRASNDARHNGHRFGKGIYFSDSFETSTSYCTGQKSIVKTPVDSSRHSVMRNYMLLCEVALGKIKELRTAYDTIEALPVGYDSVKALGRQEPNPNNDVTLPNGCMIPLGELIDCSLKPGESIYSRLSLQNNQYVVYNEAQVCIRYIIQFDTKV